MIRFSLGVSQGELVVACSAGHAGIRDGQHCNAVLIAVVDVADVHASRREINDVAGNRAMGEVQITQAGIGQSSSEVVLRCDADCFQGGRASSGAVSKQHLFSATNQLAIDEGVAQVEAERLERNGNTSSFQLLVLPALKICGVAWFAKDAVGRALSSGLLYTPVKVKSIDGTSPTEALMEQVPRAPVTLWRRPSML